MRAPGRTVRLAVTVVLVALTLAGTVRGTDAAFPFGPLRMYSTTHSLNGPVNDTWAWGTDAHGRTMKLTEGRLGIRRAEIEGELGRFQQRPSRLHTLADAYERRHPGAPKLVVVEVRTRKIGVHHGKPTGKTWTIVRVRWEA